MNQQPTQIPRQQAITCHCDSCGRGPNGSCVSNHLCIVYKDVVGTFKKCLEKESDLEATFCLDPKRHPHWASFCCNSDFCNTDQQLVETEFFSANLQGPSDSTSRDYSAMAVSVTLGLALLGVFVWQLVSKMKRRNGHALASSSHRDLERQRGAGDLRILQESSGSGSGAPTLVPLTTSAITKIVRRLEQGRYHCDADPGVYLARRRDEEVALKVLLSKDEDAFHTETDMYKCFFISHENVLTYLGSEITSRNSTTQLWIITKYHPNGSLQQYLKENRPLTVKAVLNLLKTAAAGLDYLHETINGHHHKPAIAHRDIKTSNILVKLDGSCCIADFGHAIKEPQTPGGFCVKHFKVGTTRYSAPEILDDTIHFTQFESFQQTDVYSFSLVIWETLVNSDKEAAGTESGTVTKEPYEELPTVTEDNSDTSSEELPPTYTDYWLPYDGYVGRRPSFDEMREVVCERNVRPPLEFPKSIPPKMEQDLIMLFMETWYKPMRRSIRGVHNKLKDLFEMAAKTN